MFYPVKWLDYLRFKLRTLGLDGKAVPPVLADSAPTSIAGKLRQAVEVFDSHCNYASFAGRVCNKCGRIHDGGKSVAVVGIKRSGVESPCGGR